MLVLKFKDIDYFCCQIKKSYIEIEQKKGNKTETGILIQYLRLEIRL